jgi:hypothetical protein
MKTPIQELIDDMTYMLTEGERSIYALREKARKLLEKEKEVMCEFAWEYERECRINLNRSIEDCWDKFNTEEK